MSNGDYVTNPVPDVWCPAQKNLKIFVLKCKNFKKGLKLFSKVLFLIGEKDANLQLVSVAGKTKPL
jgi:hypothetical protein